MADTPAHGWTERFTMDGVPYYHNVHSSAVTWDKPDELKSAGELESDSGTWRWVPHDTLAWAPARQETVESDGTATCALENGDRVRVGKDVPMWPLLKSSLTHLEEDLVLVDNMNEGLIIHNLRERFKRNQIYTNIGTILVSVNPFQRLPLYTPSMIDKYFHSGGNRRLPPHVFAIADNAYKAMVYDHKNQSILISGESGAGKTEATKQCLSFFAEVAGSENGVEERVIQANPILEAFGNAKTVRNNNSSRFGKYMEIHFNKRGKIVGARTENYLLEKSRVVFQAEGERTYHIFYQLVKGNLARRYKLKPNPEEYRYLRGSGCTAVEDIDDKAEFVDLCKAMETLGFTEEERDWLFSVTAACLHIGNVEFQMNKEDTAAAISNRRQVGIAAELLEVKPQTLEKALLSRTMEIPGQDPTTIPFDVAGALEAADALVKAIYGTAFDWLVQRINESLKVDSKESHSFIGVLDIFGFEIFEHNSFEQMCINFANEKLQQHFNNYTFKLEEQCYQQERIKFDHIEFIDNQPILDLIEKRPSGLLVLLDEEIRFPKGSDETWCAKVKQKHEKSDHFKRVMKVDTDFIINHYAGTVKYDAKGFLDKNKDLLYDDLQTLLSTSENARTKELFPPPLDKGKKKTSLGGQFRQQLNDLMGKLNSTEPHYVRCVKPNSAKSPTEFNSVMSLEQLRYAGVFEAIAIRQQGYPFRRTHADFVRRYRCLALKEDGWLKLSATSDKLLCEELLKISKQDFSDVQTGQSMMLYRAPEQRVMELLRNLSLERIALRIQAFTRGCIARRLHARLVKAKPVLEAAIAARTDLDKAEHALEYTSDVIGPVAIVLPFEMRQVTECKELRRKLRERKRVSDRLAAVFPKDPEQNFDELSEAVAEGVAIESYPGTPQQLKLFKDASEKLQLTIDRRDTRATLRSGTEAADKHVINAAIARAGELGIGSCNEVEVAKKMLARIAKEEQVLKGLEGALASGRCVVWSERAQADISPAPLHEQIAAAEAFGMRTAEGELALATARFLVPLREALAAAPEWTGDEHWSNVEAVLGECEREDVLEAEEVRWAADEIALRQRLREVVRPLSEALSALSEKGIKMGLGELEEELELGSDQLRRFKDRRDTLLAKSTDALARLTDAREHLDTAVRGAEESELRGAIEKCDALPVNSYSAAHLHQPYAVARLLCAMKFHMPEGARTELGLLLDDKLAGATAATIDTESGAVAVDRDAILSELSKQLAAIQEAVAYCGDVTLDDEHAKDTLAQAKVVMQLRQALVDRDWATIESTANRAVSLQVSSADVQLALDEVAGRTAAEDVVLHLTQAVADVPTAYKDETGHPSEGVLASSLAQAERLQMKDVEEIVSGRAMLDRIRTTRQALQSALDTSPFDDYVALAEGYNELYPLFDSSTAALDAAIAASEEFQYETKEVVDARLLKEEIAILYNLLYQMQEGGYYDGAEPTCAPADVVQNDALIEAYTVAAPFQARTRLGVYLILKSYHTVQLRGALLQVTEQWTLLETAVSGAEGLECEVPEMLSAREYLGVVRRVLKHMEEAEQQVAEDLLIEAVAMAEQFFYENENVQRVRALRDRVVELNEESRRALWVMDKARMEAVSAAAKDIRLTTAHFERIDGLLSLGEESWLKMEIKKAKELNDVPRKIRLGVRLKVLSLEQFESMFGFSQFKSLRSAQDFASAKLVTLDRKKLAAGMLSFSKTPIHTSLTAMEDPLLLKEAKRAFKNVLGYMGDKKYSYPTSCAQELVGIGLEFPDVRTEIYCQIIKQITDHPVIENKMRGWDLLAICTWQFPPNADMDNVLEVYLRNAPQRSSKYIANLRDVTFGTIRPTAPSADEIDAYVSAFNNPMEPTRTSEFEVPKPIADAPYTDAFVADPQEMFLETEIEIK
eukprot:TRINITY_DN2569_c0_g1_i1.p1 TRINITY_DN2569_c0_g1~~TRINITY_DN2569_c0_g1_i1.p1  ORF type:complete len:1924 (-),score=743.67 TRINITY_DN2569_c0_g1_i1:162-5840(-)